MSSLRLLYSNLDGCLKRLAIKVRRAIRQRSMLFKLLLSVSCLVCIPMLAFQTIWIAQSLKEVRRNVQESYLSVLHSSANSFLLQEEVLSQIAVRVSLNENIQRPLRNNATEYSLYTATQALNRYGREILSLESTGVCYINEGFVLVNETKYSLREYCGKLSPGSDAQNAVEQFFDTLQSLDFFLVPDSNILLVARPVSMGYANADDSIVFFVINAEELEATYCASLSARANLAITDDEGHFLLCGEDFQDHISPTELSAFLASESSFATAGEDETLSLYKYQDRDSGFTFLLSTDTETSDQKLIAFATQIRSTLLLSVVLLTAALIATLWINYYPINQMLKRIAPVKDDAEVLPELERLNSIFFAIDERCSTQDELLSDFVLNDLLFGVDTDPKLVTHYFPSTQYCTAAVASVMFPVSDTAQAEALRSKLADLTGYNVHVTRAPYRPQTIIICLADSVIDRKNLALRIHDSCFSIWNTNYDVKVGEVVADIFNLKTSYKDSTVNTLGGEATNLYDSTFALNAKRYTQSLCEGNANEALTYLKEVRRFVLDECQGVEIQRYYCYKLIGAYLFSINEDDYQIANSSSEKILSFTTPLHLFDILQHVSEDCCQQIQSTERQLEGQLQKKLLNYVAEHFRDSDLCLTSAADHIGTSIYAVSRLFKEATGQGFKEYITEKRLVYAHAQLCTTEKSIAEISISAGFESSNYFSTVFKAKYGMPPSKYRRAPARQHEM